MKKKMLYNIGTSTSLTHDYWAYSAGVLHRLPVSTDRKCVHAHACAARLLAGSWCFAANFCISLTPG